MITQLARLTEKTVGTTLSAARHPLATAGFAVGLVRGAVKGVAGGLRTVTGAGEAVPPAPRTPEQTGARTRPPARDEAPEIVEPVVPQERPVPIVEQVLAAEAAGGPARVVGSGGPATEPHPVSREEVHGEEGLHRAERDEIEEETDEALHPDA